MAVTEQMLMDALKSVIDPNTGRDFVSSRSIKNLTVTEGDVAFDVELGYPAKSQVPAFRKALVAAGCTAVDLVPLFLGAGGHVRKDIPVLMAQLAAAHPAVHFALRPAIVFGGELGPDAAELADLHHRAHAQIGRAHV